MVQREIKETLADETYILGNSIVEQGVEGIIAGFPCQDISLANVNGTGLSGERSGLFWELIDTFCLVRPRFLLLENVAALFTKRGRQAMGDILGELASFGCSVEWDCVSAASVGAPHFRARAYILAHDGRERGERFFPQQIQRQSEFSWCENVRSVEDLPRRSAIYPSQLCGGGVRVAKRLHGIGNGNPPCVIRELTKDIE